MEHLAQVRNGLLVVEMTDDDRGSHHVGDCRSHDRGVRSGQFG